jgi:WD40 repeat protein
MKDLNTCRCDKNKKLEYGTKCNTTYPYMANYNREEVNFISDSNTIYTDPSGKTSGWFISVLNNKIALWSYPYNPKEKNIYGIQIYPRLKYESKTDAVKVIWASYNSHDNSEIYTALLYSDGSTKIGILNNFLSSNFFRWTYFDQKILNFTSMAVTKDQVFVSSSSIITVFQTNGIKMKSIETKSQISCIQVQSLNSDKRIFSGNKDGKIQVWLKSNFSLIQVLDYTSSVTVLQLDKFETKLASGHSNSMINIWNSSTGELIKTLSGHSSEITALTFLNKEKYLASGSKDGSIKIWDLEKLVLLDTLPPHGASVLSLATLSPGHLISGSSDKTLRVWRYEY